MRFLTRKRRSAPTIIIISLIDILLVLLIFLMVTTTFRQHPAIKLVLPDSTQPREGAAEENLVVTVAKQPPYFYLGQLPLELGRLQSELAAHATKNPQASLTVRADTDAPFGKIVNVMDAAKAAGFRKPVSTFVKEALKP
jgi:biopolymer transport protein ExbD